MGPSHPNIRERKFYFCQTLSKLDLNYLIVQCPICTRFFAACCQHQSFGGYTYEPERPVCEHLRLVFTDGACSNNGQGYTAKAGLGIVIGTDDALSWSIVVDDTLDTAPRTNQRAELLAAIEGLKKLELVRQSRPDLEDEVNHSKFNYSPPCHCERRLSCNVYCRHGFGICCERNHGVVSRVASKLSFRLIFKISNTNGIIYRAEDGVKLMANDPQTLTYS